MKDKIRFDINPHVIKQLGAELVSDEITALMEIVKNSYDADASYVSIEINTVGAYDGEPIKYKNKPGYIVVEDDGFGMDVDTIIKSWLTISYSNKRAINGMKLKTPKGRTPLGDKGLGRLSTQRLANICEIFTSKEDTKERIHIAFDWKDFEAYDALGEVPVSMSFLKKKNSGTTLILSDLNNPKIWQGENLEKLKGELSQMVSPYKANRPFEVYIQVNGQKIDLIKENEDLREIALAKFEFEFDGNQLSITGRIKQEKLIGNKKDDYFAFIAPDNGKKFNNYFFSKFNSQDIKQGKDNYLLEFHRVFNINFGEIAGLEFDEGQVVSPGAFSGEINDFSYDSWVSNNDRIRSTFDSLANYKAFAQSQAGIKLYRNGFAVKPFGIDGQDWLKLGDAQTSASSYYTLRPKNVIGYVAISEDKNNHLKEKTDREGLISNAYSRNFMSIMYFVRDSCNSFIDQVRRSYNNFLTEYKIENTKVKTVSQAFSEIKDTSLKASNIKDDFYRIKTEIKETRTNTDKYAKSVESSSLFMTDEQKEAASLLQKINAELLNAENLLELIQPIINKAENLPDVINILEPKISVLEEQLENFSELASLGLTAEAVSHEFATISDNLAERSVLFSQKLSKGNYSESDIYILMEYINSTVNGLKIQLKHLDPTLKYNREQRGVINLEKFFTIDESEYYDTRLQKNGISFEIEIIHNFSIYTNKGKITQVFDNIINNSEYWLKERLKSDSDFSPILTIKIDKPWVYLYDNGYGIAPSIKELIFQPFFTSKPNGRGLGLFIVQQLLDSIGCTISMEPRRNNYDHYYIFSLNLSNIISE